LAETRSGGSPAILPALKKEMTMTRFTSDNTDRAAAPVTDAAQRAALIDVARANLPRHDQAVLRADAARTAFRASANWSKPQAYQEWQRLEFNYWGACEDRQACANLAAPPRNIASEISQGAKP
jgi:flagellar hook-length control protein FliK